MLNDKHEMNQNTIAALLDDFKEARDKHDFIGCHKVIGKLETLGFPDTEYFTGLAYHFNEEYRKAIEHLSQVPPSSFYYKGALLNLCVDYSLIGDYEKLCDVIEKDEYAGSSLQKVHDQIVCLEHIQAEAVLDLSNMIAQKAVVHVPLTKCCEEAELFFEICKMFSDAIVVAGECINQCMLYQIRCNKDLADFQPTTDIKRFIDEYEKWCTILNFSSRVEKIIIANGISSLAFFALQEKPWPQKLIIFKDKAFVKQTVSIIHQLLCPEKHPSIPAYICVENFLETVSHIMPQAIPQVIDQYFSIIAEAYNAGNNTAPQYLGYAYAEIIANGSDPFSLKERIESIRKSDDNYDSEEVAERIKLTRSMSRKGHEALMNALYSYAQSSEKEPGANDFSDLALQFFRVLEIEYSEKMLLPLSGLIETDKLNELVNEDNSNQKAQGEKDCVWVYDSKLLSQILSGDKKSIELGKLRTLLSHIVGRRTRNDKTADYLRSNLYTLLTQEGIRALESKKMLDVINNDLLDRYRVPGAHTGFIPFSVATEAKEYIEKVLPEIESWFK